MKRTLLLTGAALLLVAPYASTVAPLVAQVSEGTQQLGGGGQSESGVSVSMPGLSDLYWNGVPAGTEAVTQDWIGGGIEDLKNATQRDIDGNLKQAAKLSSLAYHPKMSSELSKEGIEKAKELRGEAAQNVKNMGVLDKIGKVLDILDFVSVGAKATGHAVEGDMSGMAGVLVKEATKKLMEAGGALGLSWVPGGQFMGTLAAEKAYENFVDPILDQRESDGRDQVWQEKYGSKPWMPENLVYGPDGSIRKLDADMYVDKETGLIKRRSAEEQKSYEAKLHTRWLDGRTWLKITKDLEDGKIDKAKFDEFLTNYRSRDPGQPWDPDAPILVGVARFQGSYVGRFSGGGRGAVRFTVSGNSVSGSMSGSCAVVPCVGDPAEATFDGSISDEGAISTSMQGQFSTKDEYLGIITFSGSFNGAVSGRTASGDWVGKNKWGSPSGSWYAKRSE